MGDHPPYPPFESQSFAPAISLATEDVQPPGNLAVTVNDQLVFQVISSNASFSASFFARLLRADGTISQFQKDLTGNGVRTSVSAAISLADGFLLSAAVINNSSNAPRGGMFCRIIIFRSFLPFASEQWNQVLIAAYASLYDVPTWPPGTYESSRAGQGNIRSISGTLPAAGSEINEVVPAGAVWRLISFRLRLQTAVAVANRQSDLVIDDGASVFAESVPAAVQPASLTWGYTWAPGLSVAQLGTVLTGPLPQNVILTAGMRIRTNTANLQGADQYVTPQYEVEEWIGT